jgi:signal transduction histidine kinase
MDRASVAEVDLHEGLNRTLTMLAHKVKHLDVVRDYDHTLPRVTAQPGQLNQVWTNLLDNAADAVGDAGTVTIRTRHDDDAVVVAIHDTGPGIPDDLQRRVFEPFFTTKAVGEGTGLGLDLVRRIVEVAHGGSVTLRSAPGDTTFEVRLPAPPLTPHGGIPSAGTRSP